MATKRQGLWSSFRLIFQYYSSVIFYHLLTSQPNEWTCHLHIVEFVLPSFSLLIYEDRAKCSSFRHISQNTVVFYSITYLLTGQPNEWICHLHIGEFVLPSFLFRTQLNTIYKVKCVETIGTCTFSHIGTLCDKISSMISKYDSQTNQ